MDDDDFRIIREGFLLIEQQSLDENNHIERYYEEKRVTLVSEEGCIILYYSDVKNKSFETAQFVSISGCRLVLGDHLNFEIVISSNCIIKFQSSTFEDKKQWVESLELYTVKHQPTPPPPPSQQQQQQNNTVQSNTTTTTTPHTFKFAIKGGVSLPELKIGKTNGSTLLGQSRNYNLSAPGQVEANNSTSQEQQGEDDDDDDDQSELIHKKRPINSTTLTPIVTPRTPSKRDLTEEEEEIINLFPEVEVDVILDALEFCGGDRDEVVALLSSQTRLSFQDLNSYSPLQSKKNSMNQQQRRRGRMELIMDHNDVDKELEEELERELENHEYSCQSDDEGNDIIDSREEVVNDDDPQLSIFLSKYCTTSYSSSTSSSFAMSPSLLQKLQVKTSRIQQIEEYYKQQPSLNHNSDSSQNNRNSYLSNITKSNQQQSSLIPSPQQQQQKYQHQHTNSNSSSFSDDFSDDSDEDDSEVQEEKQQKQQQQQQPQPQQQIADDYDSDEDSIEGNALPKSPQQKQLKKEEEEQLEKEKEKLKVNLVIRKKSIDEVNNSLNNNMNNHLHQWSYKPGNSITIQSIQEPIGLRSSQNGSVHTITTSSLSNSSHGSSSNNSHNNNNNHNHIIITPPSSPIITPPISPSLLSSSSPNNRYNNGFNNSHQNHNMANNNYQNNNNSQVWKSSSKSGITWDLSVSITGFLKLKDHIEYRIHVLTRHSEWIVYRRYNNFYQLHKKLRDLGQFKSISVSLPPKKLRGTSYQVAKSRQLALQIYLNSILSTFKGIFYNNSFVNVFLNSDVDSDVFQQLIYQSESPQLPLQYNQKLNQIIEDQSPIDNEQQQKQEISLSSSTPSPITTGNQTKIVVTPANVSN